MNKFLRIARVCSVTDIYKCHLFYEQIFEDDPVLLSMVIRVVQLRQVLEVGPNVVSDT